MGHLNIISTLKNPLILVSLLVLVFTITIAIETNSGNKNTIEFSAKSLAYAQSNDCNNTSAELCDGIDNDCDELIDEDFNVGESCTIGNETCQVNGTYLCSPDGTETLCNPPPEVCDNIDNDCNNQTDDLQPITCGIGACQNTVSACIEGADNTCTPLNPLSELCDSIDNDCDGQTDEDFNVGSSCSAGTGACEAQGTFVCSTDGSGTVCNAIPGQPSPEICDSIDNDCNGQTDEELGQLTCGVGACQNTVDACVNGLDNLCVPLQPQTEVCGNNIDDDCDDQIDENCEINVTKTFVSVSSKDGYARSSKVSTSGADTYIGNTPNGVQRGFLYFDTSEIPDNAVITNAKLSVYGYNFAKNNCKTVGNIDLFSCSFDPLSTNDFSGCTPGPLKNTGTYINLPETGGRQWAPLNIDKNFINNTGTTQFKLKTQDEKCTTGASGNAANICMDGGGAVCTGDKRPKLEVSYIEKITCNKLEKEICGDGIDNNCNGQIDEGCSGFGGGTDITFIVFDEAHFKALVGSQPTVFSEANKMPGKAYPTLIGGTVKPIDFGILTGDLIDYSDGQTTNAQVNSMISNMNSAVNKLNFPPYLILGNHDMPDQIKNELKKKQYSNNKTFYSFDYKGVHFIFLDGSSWNLVGPENQHTWLRDDLAAQSNDTPIVMFLHQLPTKNLDNWDQCCINNQKWLENLLGNTYGNKKNTIGFFSGHIYKYLQGKWGWGTIWQFNGTDLVDVPTYFDIDVFSCNGISKSTNLGYCVVHITGNSMTVAGYNVNSKTWTTQQVFKKTL